MAKTETFPWDPAEHLETEEDMSLYLNIALEDGDHRLIIATLDDIARARKMRGIACDEGSETVDLCQSLSTNGNPTFDAVLEAVRALGFRLKVDLASQPSNE